MGIATNQARGLFTKKLVDSYRERIQPKSFLRSFFPSATANTKAISWEVQRTIEAIAESTARGTEGNRNDFSKSTEKLVLPPYYREYFDLTDLAAYDSLFGADSSTIESRAFVNLINDATDKLAIIQEKIERRYELQCAQVLVDGIIQDSRGNFDFKRKSASLVNPGAGNYFADNVDVFAQLGAGCQFLREVGKSSDAAFVAIFGDAAWADFLNNTKFKDRQDLVNMRLDSVMAPIKNAAGGTYHGTITTGSYNIHMYTYPEIYETVSGGSKSQHKYIDTKKVVILPERPRFKLQHAVVPQLVTSPNQIVAGEYYYGTYLDERRKSWIQDVESAGLAIPVAVDQIYTLRGKAA